jgi:hypothetical protein
MTGPVELVPGEFVLFVSQGGTEEQDSRFLAILKETWQLVPSDARKTILEYYAMLHNGYPRVILGARISNKDGIGTAGRPRDGFMLWFDSLRILDMPGGNPSTLLVIAEELAHALMTARQHPTHISDPPNNDRTSPEYQAWDKAREDVMKEEVLYCWPFVDRARHEKLTAWAIETTGGLKA